jgi:hypothetical protein
VSAEDARASARLGIELAQRREFAEAAQAFERALELRPDDSVSAFNLGVVEDEMGRACVAEGDYERAEFLLKSAARHVPRNADPQANLAFLYHVLGRVDEAIAAGEAAVAVEPGHAQSHVNLALSYLLAGDYERGFREFEWRSVPPGPPDVPRWDGADLKGGRLLVTREQGLGDFILFSRFFRALQMRGARVCVEVPTLLRDLYVGFEGIDELVDEGRVIEPSRYAAFLPIAGIPHALRIGTGDVDVPVPYLRADADKTQRFAELFDGVAGKKRIGIAWAGSAAHVMDRHRSCGLAAFATLADVEGIAWISLQKGPPEAEAAHPPAGMNVLRLDDRLGNLDDTAAAIAALDLVICIDTAVAHLAGALGKPVWLLNGFGNYWLWGLRKTQTPWYPTMRLFHQPSPGDWKGLFREVRDALSASQK